MGSPIISQLQTVLINLGRKLISLIRKAHCNSEKSYEGCVCVCMCVWWGEGGVEGVGTTTRLGGDNLVRINRCRRPGGEKGGIDLFERPCSLGLGDLAFQRNPGVNSCQGTQTEGGGFPQAVVFLSMLRGCVASSARGIVENCWRRGFFIVTDL